MTEHPQTTFSFAKVRKRIAELLLLRPRRDVVMEVLDGQAALAASLADISSKLTRCENEVARLREEIKGQLDAEEREPASSSARHTVALALIHNTQQELLTLVRDIRQPPTR
jgi:hypothetical protein